MIELQQIETPEVWAAPGSPSTQEISARIAMQRAGEFAFQLGDMARGTLIHQAVELESRVGGYEA